MNANLTSVLEKISKLRALAAGTTTLAEAEAAAAKAAELVKKYQIDEADIETADPTRAEVIGDDAPLWEGAQGHTWLGALCHGLTVDHGCASISTNQSGATAYRIAGRPSDVAIVRYLFAWLMAEICRLAERERGRAAKNAFRLGAVVGVLKAMRAARAGETGGAGAASSGFGLVLRDRSKEANRFLERVLSAESDRPSRFVKPSGGRVRDGGAYERGKAAGGNLSPRAGLSAGGGGGVFQLGAGRS